MELSLEIIKSLSSKEYLEHRNEIKEFLKPMRDNRLQEILKNQNEELIKKIKKDRIKKEKLNKKRKKYRKIYYLKIKERRLKEKEVLRIHNELLNLKRRLLNNLRSRLSHSLKRNSKIKHTLEYIGCTLEELKNHLESRFIDGMNWDNYGKWHIDHIHPCASFDLSNPEEQYKCFHFSNLQPLWEKDNLKKGGR